MERIETKPSEFFQQFTLGATDLDLLAQSAVLSPGSTPPGAACRRIKFNTSGDLAVVRAKDGATVPLTGRVAGEVEDIVATKVLFAGSTAGIKFTVYW